MNAKFRQAVEALHPTLERLTKAEPHVRGSFLPLRGVYFFSESGNAMYVGRSNNIRQRYRQHTSRASQFNQAALAYKIACKGVNHRPDYRPGARERRLANAALVDAFKEAKERVRNMEFRAVEETDATTQALLEIYCAVALDAPFNDFDNH